MAYQFDFGHLSDPGISREHNEDAYSYDLSRMVWVVADGMGGKSRGEVASRIAALVIKNKAAEKQDLVQAIEVGNAAIQMASKRQLGSKMGTTVVALRINSQLAYELAWVGDSRAYLWRDGVIEALTRDHSFVQELLDSGVIDEAEAEEHPYRNVVTRSLGSDQEKKCKADTVTGKLAPGERLLLCTDGLSKELDDAAIAACLGQGKGAQATVDELVQQALDNGGEDNITALIIDILAAS
jgi:protein phosphatase